MEANSHITRNILKAVAPFAAALALLLAIFALPSSALADEPSSTTDAQAHSKTTSSSITLPFMGNDFVWFGESLHLTGDSVENDVIAAGRTIDLRDCEVDGSVRAAGQDISLDGARVSENITAAGESIAISNTDANAVAVAGNRATIGGSSESLVVFANDVFIDGEVDGDVIVGASSVTIGANARIKGTLHVSAPHDPVMQSGAEVADVEFTQTDEGASPEEAGAVLSGLGTSFGIMFSILGVIGTLVIAVLAEWLFKRHTAAAAEMIRTRTGATIGTGVVAAFVAPIAIIILCVLVITLPVAGALTLALLAMSVVADGFAGASLFKLAFPRLGRFACALAGGAIVGVASAIPFLGAVVGAAAFMYLLGYVLQTIYLNTRKPSPQGEGAIPAVETNAPEPPIPTSM